MKDLLYCVSCGLRYACGWYEKQKQSENRFTWPVIHSTPLKLIQFEIGLFFHTDKTINKNVFRTLLLLLLLLCFLLLLLLLQHSWKLLWGRFMPPNLQYQRLPFSSTEIQSVVWPGGFSIISSGKLTVGALI